ncbi:MAG TPA: lipoprotein-releasing ABC transporter permease subunit [Steroidobacteraceae bacterium]|nr:lipoprotein-releasing ABC transporter permease subunit [Steroidobacteraceae bacterium]
MSAYEWLIGTRYLRSTHRRGFVSFVALMSVCGLMLGVATLIVVLSVMNGFERELRNRILAVTAHATISGVEGPLTDWQDLQRRLQARPGVAAVVPYIESQAMLMHGTRMAGASVRGVLPGEERHATGLAQRITQGSLDELKSGSFTTILGSALAHELQVGVGDSVILIAPEGSATPTGVVPRMRRFRVVGVFESGMYEFDRGLALVHLADAALLFRTGAGVTGLRLAFTEPLRAPAQVRAAALALGGPGYYVDDWTQNHANFFRSIEITKSMMFLILLMIVAVAAFNIVATLVMIVKEKQTDIAILRTLGAGPRNILLTFAIQGILIGLAGTLLGASLGTLLADNLQQLVAGLEHLLGTQFLDARVYYMSDLPAYVEGWDVFKVCAVAFVLCALATIYPAWRAARTAPAEALRHE